MKKILSMLVILLITASSVKAQDKVSNWTFNTRGWTTNYWSGLIFGAIEQSVKHFVFDGNSFSDSRLVDFMMKTSDFAVRYPGRVPGGE